MCGRASRCAGEVRLDLVGEPAPAKRVVCPEAPILDEDPVVDAAGGGGERLGECFRDLGAELPTLCVIRLRREHADHLAGRDRLAGGDGQLGDDPVPQRVHLVLHLHRLDDADHLSGADRIPLGDRDGEDGALHRADDRVAAAAVAARRGPVAAPARRARPTAARG